MHIVKNRQIFTSKIKIILLSFFLITILSAQPAEAAFDYLFFGVNGDTTLSSMTQGDEFFWGSNCDVGGTINWSIWYDVNSNSVIDTSLDIMITSEMVTDGDLLNDIDAPADGWAISQSFMLSGEPGTYMFRAVDLNSLVSLQKNMTMVVMPSPPNQLTGQISLPGITPPNSVLANRTVFGESETGDEGALLAITDNNGNYSMNVGADGTGVEFYMETGGVEGFVAPGYITAIASGVVPNNDFVYTAATDSVYGFVKDELGNPLPFESDVATWSDNSDRYGTTRSGRYVIYFDAMDSGEWYLEADTRVSPVYLSPNTINFSRDTIGSFQQDIMLITSDAKIYARVTENGGLPTANYRIDAYSESEFLYTEGVTSTGSNNVVALGVTSSDPNNWTVSLQTNDDEFPVPMGLILETNGENGVSIGDTVDFNFVDGNHVSGTITQDPEDAPIDWSNVWIGAWGGSNGFETYVNGDGTYDIYTGSDDYTFSVYADGYIFNPAWEAVTISGDTSGIDFIVNEAHCRVTGTLVNVPTPLVSPFYTVFATTGAGDEYQVFGYVDSATATYELFVSDGSWTISAPGGIGTLLPPAPQLLLVSEAPDTLQTLDLIYTEIGGCCIGIRGNIDNTPDDIMDITDLVYLVNYMFSGGPAPVCFDEANVTGGGDGIDITELVYVVNYMFNSGPAPVACP